MSDLAQRAPGAQSDARSLMARRAFASLAMGTDILEAWAADDAGGPADMGDPEVVGDPRDARGTVDARVLEDARRTAEAHDHEDVCSPQAARGPAWLPADAGRPVLGVVAGSRGPMALGFGERTALRAFLERLAGDKDVVARLREMSAAVVFVPRGDGESTMAPAFAHVLGLTSGRAWDWMVTERPLVGTTAEDVVGPAPDGGPTSGIELLDISDSATRRAMVECLDASIPDTHVLNDLDAHRWFGVRERPGDPSSLVLAALAADVRRGAVSLGGLGVRPELRGQGIGSRLLRAVVRTGLAETGPVTLGLWADNHGARSLYERLGFELDTLVENWRAT